MYLRALITNRMRLKYFAYGCRLFFFGCRVLLFTYPPELICWDHGKHMGHFVSPEEQPFQIWEDTIHIVSIDIGVAVRTYAELHYG